MLENPGDELYFGEVYRTVLQEAWLPEGASQWQRTGISRRGRRPTQQGIYAHSPTTAQEKVRICFSKCVQAWNALPWDNPNDPPCDSRWGREYWKKQKDDGGYNCSYYDLFMKSCIKHCLSTDCVMPSAYALACGPKLTDVVCNAEYPLSLEGGCGPITMTSGPGSLNGQDVWTAPQCGEEGTLAFQDENGAKGCIPFAFGPAYHCNGLTWPDSNPDEISPGHTEPIAVDGGAAPYTWEVSGEDFTLAETEDAGASNYLIAGPDACGTAKIKVTDFCGYETSGQVRSTDGQWTLKSNDCQLSGTGVEVGAGGPPLWFDYELISGGQKQTQRTLYVMILNFGGPCPGACAEVCGDACDDCIGDGQHPIPCEDAPTELRPLRIICWELGNLQYFEWDCL